MLRKAQLRIKSPQLYRLSYRPEAGVTTGESRATPERANRNCVRFVPLLAQPYHEGVS